MHQEAINQPQIQYQGKKKLEVIVKHDQPKESKLGVDKAQQEIPLVKISMKH